MKSREELEDENNNLLACLSHITATLGSVTISDKVNFATFVANERAHSFVKGMAKGYGIDIPEYKGKI